jgi:hypothetical protein
MATLTPITLRGKIQLEAGADFYGENDGLGLSSQYIRYKITVFQIGVQLHADASTRNPLKYDALDIEEGMFMSDTSGGSISKIVSISSKTPSTFECIVEDIDMMSYRLNSDNAMGLNNSVIIFGLNPEGEPVLAYSPFTVQALAKVQSRFSLNEKDDKVKFTHALSPNLSKGDIVTVDASGSLVKYGAPAASEVKVGIVVDVYKGGKDVFVKPFNDIVRGYAEPESLTGVPGDVYYTDPNNLGEITATSGGKAVFMHLNTKQPTTVNITSVSQPSAGDTILINGISVFNGPMGDTPPVDTVATAALFNTMSSFTHVNAAITQAPGEVNAEGNALAYTTADHGVAGQDMLNIVGPNGQTPASIATISISDGINTTTISFDTPDITIYGGAYDAQSATAILASFTTAITAASLDIIAELYNSTDHNGQAIKLTTTGSATGITLVNLSANEFGANAVGTGGFTGLTVNSNLGASTLTLTRAAGGPIEMGGNPLAGGYLNQSGATSSNNGRTPFLLLIESEGGGGIDATGIDVKADLDKTSYVTLADGDSTGVSITYTPFSNSPVDVTINGLSANVGDGDTSRPCYFSNDGGNTPRLVSNIEAGDTLYWNGSVAGFELEETDEIDLIYQGSSLDVV